MALLVAVATVTLVVASTTATSISRPGLDDIGLSVILVSAVVLLVAILATVPADDARLVVLYHRHCLLFFGFDIQLLETILEQGNNVLNVH